MIKEIISIVQIILWITIAILNSRDFNSKSVIIWIATLVIILNQIQIGGFEK